VFGQPPGGEADTKDTVENVFIENPEQGGWLIEVSADELIQDSHVETPELDADYALVVSPVMSGPYPPIINGTSSADIGKEYDFTFTTTDPTGEDIYYYVTWVTINRRLDRSLRIRGDSYIITCLV